MAIQGIDSSKKAVIKGLIKIGFGKIGQKNKVGKLVMWPRLCTYMQIRLL